MTKDEMKHQLQVAVIEWVERTCSDVNVLRRFGSSDMTFHPTYEGEQDGELHFEAVIEEVRRIEVSDETNPLQEKGTNHD